jgi:phosphatidylglycerol:prolipoprotein diacylglycerol transferase
MKPVIFTIPGLNWDIPGYGLMLMLALFISIWWAARRAMKSGGSPDVILNCGLIALFAGVIGCRAMYVIHYWDQFKAQGSTLQILIAIVDVRKGGLEFYGGFLLTVIAVLAWLRWWEKVSIRWYLDIIAPSAALGLAIGRIGCFLNGCCFGSTCDLPWAVRFPFGSNAVLSQWNEGLPGAAIRQELLFTHVPGVFTPLPREFLNASDKEIEAASKKFPMVRANMKKYGLTAAELRAMALSHRSLPVHPTQLYSTITALLIALILNALYWRRTRDGQVICALFLIEPATRWLLEVIRADNPVDTVGMFTISQFLAIGMTLLGLIGLLVLRKMSPRSPRARLWEPPEENRRGKAGKEKHAAAAG